MTSSYAKLGQFLHRAGRPFMRLYVSPKMIRVRAVVINEYNEILLVRSWFGHQWWSLPGGGKHKNETPAQAASRELIEETGLKVDPADFTEMLVTKNSDPLAPFTVNCQFVRVKKQDLHISRRFEMLDVAWKPLSNIPQPHSPLLPEVITKIDKS